ncbi:MAG: hypothetical protein NVS4B9_11520 [Ktedonobacteraceae bacterium]
MCAIREMYCLKGGTAALVVVVVHPPVRLVYMLDHERCRAPPGVATRDASHVVDQPTNLLTWLPFL